MYPMGEKHMKKNQWLKQFFYLRQYLPLSVKGNSGGCTVLTLVKTDAVQQKHSISNICNLKF